MRKSWTKFEGITGNRCKIGKRLYKHIKYQFCFHKLIFMIQYLVQFYWLLLASREGTVWSVCKKDRGPDSRNPSPICAPALPEVRVLIVDRTSATSLYTSLWLWILYACSLPTPDIHSTSSQIRIWNPVGGLWWGFFAKTVYVFKAVVCFCTGAPSLIIDRVLNVTLSEKKVSTTGITQGYLELLLLILLIYTKHKYKIMKSWTDPTPSYPGKRTHPLGR